MSENYIMLNGKRVDLTDEQIKKLGLNVKEDTWIKQKYGELYYFIASDGEIISDTDTRPSDNERYKVANYCTDKNIMQQRALHETLDRLLWRFSMQNDGDKIDWNVTSRKYFITYDYRDEEFRVDYYQTSIGCALKSTTEYFYSVDIAKRAINEIIIPFMKEHPEFVW